MDTETNNINNVSEKNIQTDDVDMDMSISDRKPEVSIPINDTENESEKDTENESEKDTENESEKDTKYNTDKCYTEQEFNKIINEYIKFVFFPDIENTYIKYGILFIEIIHIIISLLCPFGLLLPSKLLIYHALALIGVMVSWYIFDGCIITLLKTKLCKTVPNVPLVPLSIQILKYIHMFFIVLTLFFYFKPEISPFKYLYRLMTYLSTNFD